MVSAAPSAPPAPRIRTIQLEAIGDGSLVRVSTGGRHIGSIRLTPEGWLPLGGFVFTGKMRPRYFRSVEEAATALDRARRGAGKNK